MKDHKTPNKWIQEQVLEWLSLPELYEELPSILSVRSIESSELGQKADVWRNLWVRWTCPEPRSRETAQPNAPPNGRPSAPAGNSGVTEGPPPVS